MNENYSELQQKAAISEIQKANKTGITCQTILLIIIALAYVLELIKGNRTVGYTILVLAMCVIPIVLARLSYANKPTDELLIMRIIGIGFAVLYTTVLFTANNNLVFTYALPMLLICMLFNNVRFVYIVGVGIILENVFDVGYEIVIRKNTSAENIVSYEIQVLLMIMCVVFFVMINRVYGLFSEIRTARLTLEKNKINGILDDILGISKEMSDNVELMDVKMVNLNTSMEQTLNSMSEVSSGTNESAEAIQNQLLKTEQIQDSIGSVEGAVEEISSYMDKSIAAVSDGRGQVENLTKLVAESEKAGNDVIGALDAFTEYTNKMNSITELINSVASQTSLLALNASIEAARAGEAGRGFAVVASEISNLAGQTTSATSDINDLISNISSQLNTMVDKINSLIETNKIQGETAARTAENFTAIDASIGEMKKQSNHLSVAVENLADANKEIVDSIQTISAITEEVSAHSSETYTASEMNQNILKEVEQIVVQLSNDAQRLNEES